MLPDDDYKAARRTESHKLVPSRPALYKAALTSKKLTILSACLLSYVDTIKLLGGHIIKS